VTDLATRYTTAESLLANNLRKLIRSPQARPNWIRDTETFWYRNRTADGTEFVFVDAEAGVKRPAFDHVRMAKALSARSETPVEPHALPFPLIDLRDQAVRVDVLGKRLEVSLDTYEVTELGDSHPFETPSPDGRFTVGIADHNLYVREVDTGEVRQGAGRGHPRLQHLTLGR
jgi:hypothetical protein